MKHQMMIPQDGKAYGVVTGLRRGFNGKPPRDNAIALSDTIVTSKTVNRMILWMDRYGTVHVKVETRPDTTGYQRTIARNTRTNTTRKTHKTTRTINVRDAARETLLQSLPSIHA